MKVFLAVLVFVACASAEEWTAKNNEELKEIRTECLKEHPLSTEQWTKLKNFEVPNEEPVRKYLLCTFVKLGIFCPHGGFHADRIAQQFKMDIHEEEVKEVADFCIAKFPRDNKPNDVAVFEVHECLLQSKLADKLKNYIKKQRETA